MSHLPPALQALGNYRQFILWRLEGDQKRPVNPYTGTTHDPHDPAIWVDAATAYACAEALGCGVGFVFTRLDPFFFLDIDKCLQEDGNWDARAMDLCARFAGAAIEVSQSGRGLHIFGTGRVPLHSCKNAALKLEFYTEARFVALTGAGAIGSAAHDCSQALSEVIPVLFPDRGAQVPVELTEGPCADWNGPEDDEQLIDLMLNSRQSGGAVFGGKASIQALWVADENTLGLSYPDPQGMRPFDHSAADAALCQHLAFWTGRDAARINRLFERSALYREKWAAREDYRERTITRAIGLNTAVYGGKVKAATSADPIIVDPVAPAKVLTGTADVVLKEGFQYLAISQQKELFEGCVYVRDLHRAFTPDGGLLKPDQFRATYGGYVFALDAMNDKTTKSAWEAFTESQAATFPKAHGLCFRPEHPPGAVLQEESRLLVNTYVPIVTSKKAGDISRFTAHLEKMLPNPRDREILLAWMAACVQYPGCKFQWSPLVQGCEGNGKSLLIRCLAYAIGHRYTHLPNAQDLSNKFNAWLSNKLFIGVEEIYSADRREIIETLKPMITNDRIDIQGKGDDQFTGDNRANFLMCTNHKDAILKTHNDRRFAVFYCAQQEPEDMVAAGFHGEYFPRIYDWLRGGGYAMVNHYLSTYRIPAELNPAGNCHRAPGTSSTNEAISISLGGIEQEVLEAIAEGRTGFAGGWVSSIHLERLLSARRDSKRIPPAKRSALLKSLGYVPHPGLPDGRSNSIIPMDGGKPRLYIKFDSIPMTLKGAKQVVDAYVKAQQTHGADAVMASEIFTKPGG